MVLLKVTSTARCQYEYRTSEVKEDVLCGEGWDFATFGKCDTDWGAPMVTYEDSVPTLIGIKSFKRGSRCLTERDPMEFVMVSKYLSWIHVITGIPIRDDEDYELKFP